MKHKLFTASLINFLQDKCDQHNKETYNDVDLGDILYTYFNSDNETIRMLNDWDEGKNNDPWWDEKKNMHSAESFILDMCEEINKS